MTPFENPNINTFDPGWEYYFKLIKINIKVENETKQKYKEGLSIYLKYN